MTSFHPPLRPTPSHGIPIPATARDISSAEHVSATFPLTALQVSGLVRIALQEDEASHDVSTLATVMSDRHVRGSIVARGPGVIAGLELAMETFRQMDSSVSLRVEAEDGSRVDAGTRVLFMTGHARGILSAERTALNYLQHLSGIATLTNRFVAAVEGTGAQVLDTRKTLPGWRALEKYAVRAGGGVNHRMDLRSAVLIKDNHLAAIGGDIRLAVSRSRELAVRGAAVEVECDTLAQVEIALEAGADIILLDNMSPEMLREAVTLCSGRAITEASGGVTLETVRSIAETGVNRISVGALTHSAPALDLGLDFDNL